MLQHLDSRSPPFGSAGVLVYSEPRGACIRRLQLTLRVTLIRGPEHHNDIEFLAPARRTRYLNGQAPLAPYQCRW